jgi:hypothetical protein
MATGEDPAASEIANKIGTFGPDGPASEGTGALILGALSGAASVWSPATKEGFYGMGSITATPASINSRTFPRDNGQAMARGGDDICVEQIAGHRSTSRTGPRTLGCSISTSRSGDEQRRSTSRWPERAPVRRENSSSDRTTTVPRPCTVTCCGPSLCALRMSSESHAQMNTHLHPIRLRFGARPPARFCAARCGRQCRDRSAPAD